MPQVRDDRDGTDGQLDAPTSPIFTIFTTPNAFYGSAIYGSELHCSATFFEQLSPAHCSGEMMVLMDI